MLEQHTCVMAAGHNNDAAATDLSLQMAVQWSKSREVPIMHLAAYGGHVSYLESLLQKS